MELFFGLIVFICIFFVIVRIVLPPDELTEQQRETQGFVKTVGGTGFRCKTDARGHDVQINCFDGYIIRDYTEEQEDSDRTYNRQWNYDRRQEAMAKNKKYYCAADFGGIIKKYHNFRDLYRGSYSISIRYGEPLIETESNRRYRLEEYAVRVTNQDNSFSNQPCDGGGYRFYKQYYKDEDYLLEDGERKQISIAEYTDWGGSFSGKTTIYEPVGIEAINNDIDRECENKERKRAIELGEASYYAFPLEQRARNKREPGRFPSTANQFPVYINEGCKRIETQTGRRFRLEWHSFFSPIEGSDALAQGGYQRFYIQYYSDASYLIKDGEKEQITVFDYKRLGGYEDITWERWTPQHSFKLREIEQNYYTNYHEFRS